MRLILMYGLMLAAVVLSTRRFIFGVYIIIVFSALSQYDDMPRSILGITGLNPLNLLTAWVFLMLVGQHAGSHRIAKNLPPAVVVLLALYAVIIVLAYARGLADLSSLRVNSASINVATMSGFTVEFLINPFKVLLPALALYLGIRSQRDVWMAVVALGLMALILAVITIKNMGLAGLFDQSIFMSRRHRIHIQTGLHANDLALVMVQASWATALTLRLRMRFQLKVVLVVCLVAFSAAVAMCHSRAGFLAFVVTGLVLGVACWRKLLIVLPVALVAIAVAVPSIRERALTGSAVQDVSGEQTQDWEAITAGRTEYLWPHTIAQIGEAPILGYGRMAILRTEMFERIEESSGAACPTHPHNAYLELLCDGGAISLFVVLAGLLGLAVTALTISNRKENPIVALVGGLGLVAICPLMVMGLTGQSFWPRENVFLSACLIAILLRTWTLLPTVVLREHRGNLLKKHVYARRRLPS